jgi:hypothetical protein
MLKIIKVNNKSRQHQGYGNKSRQPINIQTWITEQDDKILTWTDEQDDLQCSFRNKHLDTYTSTCMYVCMYGCTDQLL